MKSMGARKREWAQAGESWNENFGWRPVCVWGILRGAALAQNDNKPEICDQPKTCRGMKMGGIFYSGGDKTWKSSIAAGMETRT
jgi:hypothetical protein